MEIEFSQPGAVTQLSKPARELAANAEADHVPGADSVDIGSSALYISAAMREGNAPASLIESLHNGSYDPSPRDIAVALLRRGFEQ